MKLSLVIPAYNEEKRIGEVISSYSKFLSEKYDYEIIIICDGTDNTARIVKNTMAVNSRIRLVEFRERQGKGGGIIHGLKESRGDIIGFVDSDKAVSPAEFGRLVDSLDGYGCAIASRRVKGARILNDRPYTRRLPSMVFNRIVNALFNLDIMDTQCGAKVFKKEVIMDVLPLLRTRGFEFDVELLWRIKSKGYSIREVPVVWEHKDGSTFSLRYSFSMFVSLVKTRFLFFKEVNKC